MSTTPVTPPAVAASGSLRFRVFIDFWNLQITLNERESEVTGLTDARFLIDWHKLPDCLVREAAAIVRAASYSYEGSLVFTSSDSKTVEGRKYHKWVTSWLDRQPGIQVNCSERHPKHAPKCPACHQILPKCSHCGADLAGTIEKGVDTAIATNMIRLAWERAYNVAVLVSSDADLVPAAEFLDQRGFRIIQAGFPPLGSHLSRACWATLDIFRLREQFRRT